LQCVIFAAIKTHSHTQWALVTGAASGLGASFLKGLARRGYNIVGVSKPGDCVAEVARRIAEEYGVKSQGVDLDLSEKDCAEVLKEEMHKSGIHIDFLVNNVGIGGTSEFIESRPEGNRLMMDLNMQTTVNMCREFLPDMAAKGEGYVLNVSSMAANFAMPYKSIYSASKAFVRAFSIGVRGEMKPFGVSVSVVQPGAMLTNPVVIEQLRYGSSMARMSAMTPDTVADSTLNAAFKGKAVIVPGTKNWLTLGLLRVFPRPLTTAMAVFNYVRTKKKAAAQ